MGKHIFAAALVVMMIGHVLALSQTPEVAFRPGEPVTPFEVTLMDGAQTVSSASLLGRTYLLDFWATWCSPCLAEMPYLEKAYEKFREQGLVIVSLSLDDTDDEVERFRKEHWPMRWKHAKLEKASNVDGHPAWHFSDGYIWNIPHPVLVDSDGRVVADAAKLRGESLLSTLERHFTPPASPDGR